MVDGWTYSRLSTTHGHITDCKLLVCMYWTRLVLVRPATSLYSASPLKHDPMAFVKDELRCNYTCYILEILQLEHLLNYGNILRTSCPIPLDLKSTTRPHMTEFMQFSREREMAHHWSFFQLTVSEYSAIVQL